MNDWNTMHRWYYFWTGLWALLTLYTGFISVLDLFVDLSARDWWGTFWNVMVLAALTLIVRYWWRTHRLYRTTAAEAHQLIQLLRGSTVGTRWRLPDSHVLLEYHDRSRFYASYFVSRLDLTDLPAPGQSITSTKEYFVISAGRLVISHYVIPIRMRVRLDGSISTDLLHDGGRRLSAWQLWRSDETGLSRVGLAQARELLSQLRAAQAIGPDRKDT